MDTCPVTGHLISADRRAEVPVYNLCVIGMGICRWRRARSIYTVRCDLCGRVYSVVWLNDADTGSTPVQGLTWRDAATHFSFTHQSTSRVLQGWI